MNNLINIKVNIINKLKSYEFDNINSIFTNISNKLKIKNKKIVFTYYYNEDEYINNEMDLVIYTEHIFEQKINEFKDKTFFTKSKSKNTLFLLYIVSESHAIFAYKPELLPFNLINNYFTFYESNNSYSFSHNDDSKYNFRKFVGEDRLLSLISYIDNGKVNHKINKTKFCASCTSHITEIRNIFINKFSEYKTIDNYGYVCHNVEKEKYTDDELNKILPNYKFKLAIENTASFDNESYITEKIFDAYLQGCVPIYWGNNKQIYEILNPNSMINITSLTYEESLYYIKHIDQNDELYYNMLNTNIFNCDIYKYINERESKKYLFLTKILLRIINENKI